MKLVSSLMLTAMMMIGVTVTQAQELRTIEIAPITTLAVDKPLKYDNGQPVAVIDTGIITSESGAVARGPHSFTFTLKADAAFPVVVKGLNVNPGETVNFVENLTQVNSRLVIPIYPAQKGVDGNAEFTLDLPEILINACPVGFTEDVTDCFKVNYDQVVYECPVIQGVQTTYRADTKDCREVSQVLPIEYCTAPFEKVDGSCLHTYSVPAEGSCPTTAGWSRDGYDCNYYDKKPVNTCPSGFVKRGDYCFELFEKIENCPTGYTNNGTECVNTETQQAEKVCDVDNGYSITANNCYRVTIIDATLSCADSEYSLVNRRCEFLDEKAPEQICAGDNWSKQGDICVSTIDVTPSQKCEAGYVKENGLCTREASEAASVTCDIANGFSLLSSPLRCEKVIQAGNLIGDCPANHTFNATTLRCEESIDIAADVFCPTSGFSLTSGNSACRRTVEIDAIATCSTGDVLLNRTTCEKEVTTISSNSCLSGYSYSSTNDRCEKVEDYPSTEYCSFGELESGQCKYLVNATQPILNCDAYSGSEGVVLHSRSGTCRQPIYEDGTPYCGSGAAVYDPSRNLCVNNYQYDRPTSCPTGSVLRSGKCIEDINVPVTSSACPTGFSEYNFLSCRAYKDRILACPEGARQEGSQCYERLGVLYTTSNTQTCPLGEEVDSVRVNDGSLGADNLGGAGYYIVGCVQYSVTPSDPIPQTCDFPWVQHSSTQCRQNVTRDLSCPEGTSHTFGRCEGEVEVDSIYDACISGYAPSKSDESICVRQTTFSSSFIFSDNTTSPTSPKLMRTDVLGDAAQTCESGRTLVDGSCELYGFVPASYRCDSVTGVYTNPIDSTKCKILLTEDATKVCPSSAVLSADGTNCVSKSQYDATYTCTGSGGPESQWLVGDSCNFYEYEDREYSCSASDLTRVGNRCTGVRDISTELRCDNGGVIVNGKCETTITGNLVYYCQSGWLRDGQTCTRPVFEPIELFCEPGDGELVNGLCKRPLTKATEPFCEEDWTYGSAANSCTKLLTQNAVESCPQDYQLATGQKCRIEQTQPFEYSCNTAFGYSYNSTTQRCEKVNTTGITLICSNGSLVSESDTQCRNRSFSTNVGTCESGYILNPATTECERILKEDAVLQCQDDERFTLDSANKKCDFLDNTQTSKRCDTPKYLNGEETLCLEDIEVPVTLSCDDSRYSPVEEEEQCVWIERVPFGQ